MADNDRGGAASAPGGDAQASKKPKRVRTGCLTCRERHLKCDEGLPNCQNCTKSNRTCKRGVRLNFIDTKCEAIPIIPQAQDWTVQFLDESRDIASEYKGGLSKYSLPETEPVTALTHDAPFDFSTNNTLPAPTVAHQPLPPIQGILPEPYQEDQSQQLSWEQPRHPQHHPAPSNTESTYSHTPLTNLPQSAYSVADRTVAPADETRDYLTSQDEVLYMQVFVEEVGLWMDSMDPQKHFSRLLPFHSLHEPMLLNAFLACGARHLTLVNAKYSEDKALHFYDTATRYLLNSLQNPNRNTIICATTAVILNVYEIMCEKALQRMNHIAGARALIKECGWNAKSTGVGAACFWLNVGMELLSCLHFNWQVAWDPDDWGVDMDFHRETEPGREEIWTHRIVYIVAKICNFRSSIPRYQDSSPHNEQMRLQSRYSEWRKLKDWCDAWNDNIPRTMHPMAYLHPGQTISQSAFPEVWLIKRATIVARLFYHTAMVLMAQINPLMPVESNEMHELQNRHSQQVCGIVAHVKDRGVASVALRSLAIAAECLTTRQEQEEVLQIFTKIRKETGWNVGFVYKELKEKWGWNAETSPSQAQPPRQTPPTHHTQPSPHLTMPISYPSSSTGPVLTLQPSTSMSSAPNQTRRRPQPGILNPILSHADFTMPHHPYQSHYVAPNPLLNSSQSQQFF